MFKKKTRVISLLCVILMILTFISTCIVEIDISNSNKVYADSNDNRKLNLAIAEGKTRAEISEAIANDGGGLVDMNSMRCIALYLSNFYQPFVTSLTDGSDIAISNKTADDKEAEQQNQQMGQFSTDAINALTKYCGVNEEVAQILVKNTLKQSLDTCHTVYVRRSAVEKILNVDVHTVANTLQPSNSKKSILGFAGMSRETTMGKVDVWRVGGDNKNETLGYNFDNSLLWYLSDGDDNATDKTIKDYISQLFKDGGSKNVNGDDYVPLTYFLYLAIIQYSANNALPASGEGDSKSLLNFYWYDTDTNNMVTCFDAGGTCTQAFLLATNEIDVKNGVGTSLSSLPLDAYDALSEDAKKGDELRKATIFFNPIFVNWVGDLVINDGKNTFVMVPGCLNPYSMVTISNGRTDYLNGVSVKALTYKANDLLESAKGKKASSISSMKEESSLGGNITTSFASTVLGVICDEYHKSVRTGSTSTSFAPSITMTSIAGNVLYNYTGLDYGKENEYKYRAKIVKRFFNIFKVSDDARDDRKKAKKWASPLVINIDTKEICTDTDIDLSGTDNVNSEYVLPNTKDKTLINALNSAYSNDGYYKLVLNKPSENKTYNCVVLYSFNGFYNLLRDADYDTGDSMPWKLLLSSYDNYCVGKFKNLDKAAKGTLFDVKSHLDVTIATNNGVTIFKLLDNLKLAKHVNDTKVTTKDIDGDEGRYDIATKGTLPNKAQDMSFSLKDCGITSSSDDNNKRIKDGDSAMFTKNTYVVLYGDTSKDNDDFDGETGLNLKAKEMFELLKDYGLIYATDNCGKNYCTFPSLIWATMLCDYPDGVESWITRISCGCRSVSSTTYDKNYFYLRLSGTKKEPSENLKGYKMHDQVIYYPDYSVDLSEFSSAIKTANIFETTEMLESLTDMSPYTSVSNGYGQTLKLNDTVKRLYQNIFMTYAFAEFNYENALETFDENINVVDMKCNWDAFPEGSGNIDFTYIEDTTGKEIESFVYYLLHPTKGIAYLATWFRNKVSGILLNIHESIVGSSDSNYTTGMTNYLGNSSYTTMPKLTDIKLLDNILGIYKNIMIYLILAILIVLFCFIVIGEITIQRGIIGVLSFALLAFLPPYMINAAANISNNFSDNIFSTKFEYWAISQMETYMDIINISEGDAVITNNALELSTQVSLASASTSVGGEANTGYSGTMLKWMSPKKYACGLINQALQQNTAATSHATFLRSMVEYSANTSSNGQEFVHNVDDALYLYRDYVDIYRYGSNSYNLDVYCGEFLNQGYSDLVKGYTKNNSTQSKDEHGVYNVWHARKGGNLAKVPLSTLYKLTYSSGIALSDVITSNYAFGVNAPGTNAIYSVDNGATDGVTLSNLKKSTEGIRSTYAVLHGFLFNTFGNSIDENKNGVNYFSYNNTRASTLLLSYAATVAQTQDALNTFREDVEKGEVKLTYKKFIKQGKYSYGIPHDSYYADIKVFNKFDTYYGVEIPESTTNTTPTVGSTSGTEPVINDTTTSTQPEESTVKSVTMDSNEVENQYKMLSDFYYNLYTESPYFYFNYNIRDQLVNNSDVSYQFSKSDRTASKNGLITMWLNNKQDYFYNFSSNAGDGYGELRDFMNFHDFFYYVLPTLQPGIDLLYEWDNQYGYFLYDDCSLKFTNSGTIKYDGKTTNYGDDNNLESIISEEDWNNLTEDDRYKLWHNYNVNLINLSYCSWLDTMEDCEYAKKETIRVLGQKYTVTNPLDPTTYFDMALEDFTDENGNSYKAGDIVSGRFMVFSRSEMKYYGLNWEDLTRVEQKIISVQDEVYKETLKLVNYKAVSDENLIHAFAMLETFIFNKEFSQKNITNDGGYIMYPQGYELKAFTYDAYLRLVLAESSNNIDLEVEGTAIDDNNDSVEVSSIYSRIMKKTSIFFGILLILNDLVAVYVIPAIKILFLMVLFFLSLFMLISAVFNLELNIINNFIKSVVTPLFVFTGSCLGLSFITSLFMSNGADYITEGMTTLSLGDPTMTLVIMIILNCMYCYINIKLLVKCYKAMVDYLRAITTASVGALTGAARMLGRAVSGKGRVKVINKIKGGNGSGYGASDGSDGSGSGISSDEAGASKRGSLNGVGAVAGGALAGAGLANMANEEQDKDYQKKLDFYNGNFNKSEDALAAREQAKAESASLRKQASELSANAEEYRKENRKKHRSEINLEKSEAAKKKYDMAREDMHDKDLSIMQRAKAFGNSVKYGKAHLTSGVKGNIQKKVESNGVYKRVDKLLNGSDEFRGMSASQVRTYKTAKNQANKLRSQGNEIGKTTKTLKAKANDLKASERIKQKKIKAKEGKAIQKQKRRELSRQYKQDERNFERRKAQERDIAEIQGFSAERGRQKALAKSYSMQTNVGTRSRMRQSDKAQRDARIAKSGFKVV